MNLSSIAGMTLGKRLRFTNVSGTAATSGDNTLVSAPGAGKRIVVKAASVQNESSADTTITLDSGSTSVWRALLKQYDALSLSFELGQEWRLGDNEALILNLSGANSHGYNVMYYTEDV